MKTFVFIITRTPYEGEYALSTINLAVALKNVCTSNCRVALVFAGDGLYCLKKNQKTRSFSIEDSLYIAHSVGVEIYYTGTRKPRNTIKLAEPMDEEELGKLVKNSKCTMII